MRDPVILLTGGDAITVNADFTFEDPGVAAWDYLGVDLSDRVTVDGTVTAYLVGDYVLTYAVEDDYGNRTEVKRSVTVVPVQLPKVVMPPKKTIYLTFDDGPSKNTEVLLNILKKYDVKATFFVVGDRGQKHLIKRAYEEGHSIGIHCYTHVYKTIYANEEAYLADFLAAEKVVQEQTGQYTTIFRFPGGAGNTVSISCNHGIMTRLTKIMEDMGYRYFDWTDSSTDANKNKEHTSAFFFSILCNRVMTHNEYSVILQHDLNADSIVALSQFIPWALKNGYTFLPLDMTSPVVHTKVRN
jgi:peptidoglycan/xylan/chitin deacetylase (PgdA/CDA1 family)